MSDHRQIKPGEIFEAYPTDVPKVFRSTIVPLDPIIEITKQTPSYVPLYFLQARKARGWYNVVDKEGAIINEHALRKEEAEQLVKNKQDAEGRLL